MSSVRPRESNPLYRSVEERERDAPRVIRIGSSTWPWHLAVAAVLIYELVVGHYIVLGVIAGLWAAALLLRGLTTTRG